MSRLGGQVLMAASAPHRADLRAITDWLADELENLGVEIYLNSYVDEEVVGRISPDEVVIASGTAPRDDGFQQMTPATGIDGFDMDHVYSSWDVLGFGNIMRYESPAVVYDDTGTFEAISVADILLEKGLSVTMVGRNDSIGARLNYPPVTAGAARERLYSGDFDFVGGHHLIAIRQDHVEIGVIYANRVRQLQARTVVFVGHNSPSRDLWLSLQGNGPKAHMIGDVRGHNNIMSAIHAGNTLGRNI
jgi:hypothetical protein